MVPLLLFYLLLYLATATTTTSAWQVFSSQGIRNGDFTIPRLNDTDVVALSEKASSDTRDLPFASWAASPDSVCWSPPNRRDGPSSVTLVTMLSHIPASMRRMYRENKMIFALVTGAQYCEFQDTIEPTRSAAWGKLGALLSILPLRPMGAMGGWVVWLDADAVFRPPFKGFGALGNQIADEHAGGNRSAARDIAVVMGSGVDKNSRSLRANVRVERRLSSGVIMVRNTPYAHKMLREVYKASGDEVDKFYGDFMSKRLYEQLPMVHWVLRNPDWSSRGVILESDHPLAADINGGFRNDSLPACTGQVVHYAGVDMYLRGSGIKIRRDAFVDVRYRFSLREVLEGIVLAAKEHHRVLEQFLNKQQARD